jgi:plasmid maintenance system antidote protein VapI
MNAERRKIISEKIAVIEELVSQLQEVFDAEDEAFGNMPESLQLSERGDAMAEGMVCIENAINSLETAAEDLGNI